VQDKFQIRDIGAAAEATGDWRSRRANPALADVYQSVTVPKSGWRKMGALTAPPWLAILAVVIAAIIVLLNMKLLYDFL
jgi:hypothetical protein